MALDRATDTFLRQFGESATITTRGGAEVTANVYLTNLENFEEGEGIRTQKAVMIPEHIAPASLTINGETYDISQTSSKSTRVGFKTYYIV